MTLTSASGASQFNMCPASGTVTSRAPGTPAASRRAWLGGVVRSAEPTITTVGTAISARRAVPATTRGCETERLFVARLIRSPDPVASGTFI